MADSRGGRRSDLVRARARERQQRRHEVFEAEGMLRLHTAREAELARAGDQQRNVGRALIGFAFQKEAMVAEQFAVIGGGCGA